MPVHHRARRVLGGLAVLSLAPGLVAVQGVAGARTEPAAAAAAVSSGSVLTPTDGVYRARIVRTERGIPHITANDYGSLGYGEGYATAETSICNLADTVLTARGQRSRYLGP